MFISKEIFSFLVIIVIVSAFIAIIIRSYNRLVKLRNSADKAFSNIDVLLIQRHDEIPNLVEVVKQYAQHEAKLIESLTQLRSHYSASVDINSKVKDANKLSTLFSQVNVIDQAYPNLKTNMLFLQLQKRLTQLENQVADRREFFNDSVELYNNGTQVFPVNIIALLFGFKKRDLLNVAPTNSR